MQLNHHTGLCTRGRKHNNSVVFLSFTEVDLVPLCLKNVSLHTDYSGLWLRHMQIYALPWQLAAWSAFIYHTSHLTV